MKNIYLIISNLHWKALALHKNKTVLDHIDKIGTCKSLHIKMLINILNLTQILLSAG